MHDGGSLSFFADVGGPPGQRAEAARRELEPGVAGGQGRSVADAAAAIEAVVSAGLLMAAGGVDGGAHGGAAAAVAGATEQRQGCAAEEEKQDRQGRGKRV